MNSLSKVFILVVVVLVIEQPQFIYAAAEENIDEYVEDASEGQVIGPQKGNWIAVPMPVSNPTVGTGLGAVLMYLHPQEGGDSDAPNATSGLAGLYTHNDSWLAGIFHEDYWKDDTYRFKGFVGYGEFNLKFYGIGDNPILGDNPIDYSFAGAAVMLEIQARIPHTKNWFAGIHYLLIDSDTVFEASTVDPDLPDERGNIRTAGLGLLTTYDSRDDNYYPGRGRMFQAKWTDYGAAWGGDPEYNKFRTFFNHYQPFGKRIVLALRTDLQTSSGDTPFFDLPFLDMRGFSRDRYRDNNTLSLVAEGRYKFLPRWGVVLFGEGGWFAEKFSALTKGGTITSYGAGLRWQVTKEKKLNLGVDVAFSADDSAFYIQIGEKF